MNGNVQHRLLDQILRAPGDYRDLWLSFAGRPEKDHDPRSEFILLLEALTRGIDVADRVTPFTWGKTNKGEGACLNDAEITSKSRSGAPEKQ